VVEFYLETIEDFPLHFPILGSDLFRGNSLILCADRDGNSMVIGATDIDHIVTEQSEEANVDVGGKVHPSHMAEMGLVIGIGERCGDDGALTQLQFVTQSLLLN